MMDDELQLISDGDGLAVIGDPVAVERFLTSEGLASTDLGLHKLRPALGAAAGVTHGAAIVSGHSARWVKLTKESADHIKNFGLMKGSTAGVSRGVVQARGGDIKGIVEFAAGHGKALANPAFLAGAAGIMAQLAMQEAIREITRYLATIDEKVDDVLRAHKDSVLADMIGVELAIDEAMMIREQVGAVSDVTWSKVQATTVTVGRTQAYALRQLDALADKLERRSKVGDLAKAARNAESTVQEWLAVLARCYRLQEATGVLELDRVLDATPGELDQHRLGLRAARQNRLELIARSTDRLVSRIDAAAGSATTKVLLHPAAARAVVESSNRVATTIDSFHGSLGIERDRDSLQARRWVDAAAEVRDKALETGVEGVGVAKRIGSETVGRARSATSKVSSSIAGRLSTASRNGGGARSLGEHQLQGARMSNPSTNPTPTPDVDPVAPGEVDPETGTDPDGTPTENPSG